MLKPPVFYYRNVSATLILLEVLSLLTLGIYDKSHAWLAISVLVLLPLLTAVIPVLIKRNAKQFILWRLQIKAWVKETYGVELSDKDLSRLSTPQIQSTNPLFVDGIHEGSPNRVFYTRSSYYYVSYPIPVGDETKRSYILTIEPSGKANLEYISRMFMNFEHDLVPFKDPYRVN